MQLANVLVRLNGELGNSVPKVGVTPAEILVLQHIHGTDAVVDIRPTGFDKKRRHDGEFARLARIYDPNAGDFTSTAGEEKKSIMAILFPGAIKRLPVTLDEIGIGIGAIATEEPVIVPGPILPPVEDEDEPVGEGEDADAEDGAGGGSDAEATAPTTDAE
jgi:hypothetical protein